MAQATALPAPRFHFGRLDFTRISAEAGAIAINGAALLLLLAPLNMAVVPAMTPPDVHIYEQIKPKENPKPPEPPKKVEVVKPAPTAPAVQPQKIDVPQPPVFLDAQPNDLPAQPDVVAKVDPGLGNTITQPLAGAHLEYEAAPPPRYPIEAIRGSLTGTVVLRVLVDIDGRPIDVQVETSSGHRVLDAAARKQVLGKWRFKPAIENGRAVQAIGLVPVAFNLQQ